MSAITSANTASGLAIDLAHVAKTYRGKVKALRGIEMRVARGEVFGLLGPNGAGKSTLVKILMTVIRPSQCKGGMLGHSIGDKSALQRVGYLPEHHRFPPYLTGGQVLDFYGAMGGVPRAERKKRIGQLLELVGMTKWEKKKVGGYSKGMRQRVGIAQALMNDPELVLLDEPTDGVDPVGRRDIRGICQRLREEGRTVFINSHLLSELEMVCDRVAILVQGTVREQGTLDELTAGQERYEIELAGPLDSAERLIREALPLALPESTSGEPKEPQPNLARRVAARGELETGEWVELDRGTLRVGTADAERMKPILAELVNRGATIKAVHPYRPSLEDLFMAAVTDPNTGEALLPGAGDDKKGGAK